MTKSISYNLLTDNLDNGTDTENRMVSLKQQADNADVTLHIDAQ